MARSSSVRHSFLNFGVFFNHPVYLRVFCFHVVFPRLLLFVSSRYYNESKYPLEKIQKYASYLTYKPLFSTNVLKYTPFMLGIVL
jgi:hypothetical protein